MGSNSIGRRAVVVGLGSTPLTLPAVVSGSVVKAGSSAISFYVAGTRFHPSVSRLRAGAVVSVIPGLFNGSFGFALEIRDGHRIGYVPAKIVPFVKTATVRAGWLSAVDYGTVPWKTLQVVLELI